MLVTRYVSIREEEKMPIGVIINACSVLFGGIAGALVGHKLSPKFKTE